MVCFQRASLLSAIPWAALRGLQPWVQSRSGHCPGIPRASSGHAPHPAVSWASWAPRAPALTQHLEDSPLLGPRKCLRPFYGEVLSHTWASLLLCTTVDRLFMQWQNLLGLWCTALRVDQSPFLSLICFEVTQRSDAIAVPETQHQGMIKAHHTNYHFAAELPPVSPEQEAQELGSQKFPSA